MRISEGIPPVHNGSKSVYLCKHIGQGAAALPGVGIILNRVAKCSQQRFLKVEGNGAPPNPGPTAPAEGLTRQSSDNPVVVFTQSEGDSKPCEKLVNFPGRSPPNHVDGPSRDSEMRWTPSVRARTGRTR